jgi:hypothetical protein
LAATVAEADERQLLRELRIHLRRRLLLAREPHDREHVLLFWWQRVVGRRLVERRLALVMWSFLRLRRVCARKPGSGAGGCSANAPTANESIFTRGARF